MRKNSNQTYYHYRVEIIDEEGALLDKKWFHTLPQICDEFNTSNYFIYNNMKTGKKIKNNPNIKVIADYKPVYIKVLNT